jgi:CRISPR-associated protein Cmr2
MAAACPDLAETDRPTLSVGLGVAHVMESMGELLALGREAEKLAKGGALADENRNALAVIVDKRSGGRISWRARWTTWGNDPAARLRADAALLVEPLSSRKIYEIARTLARLPKPDGASDPAWARILALEVRRSLARTRGGEAGIELDAIGLSLDDHTDYTALYRDDGAWIERMLVARVFASADPPRRHKKEAA